MVARTFSGRQLRRLRTEAGLSRHQLAVAADSTSYSVAAYELGTINPSVPALGRLAAALDCSIDSLFESPEQLTQVAQ